MITMYTSNNCVACKAAKRLLDRLGVEFCTINLDDHPITAKRLRDAGHRTLPVIEGPGGVVAGLIPDRIKDVVTARR